MRILSFEFHDGATGWTLEPLRLEPFNLLVGLSGAGKTRIVRAIEQVCAVALGLREDPDAEEARGARFTIEFVHDDLAYRWEAELEPPVWRKAQSNGSAAQAEEPLIRSEKLTHQDRVIIERTPERFLLNGAPMPRLDRTKSAIAILKEDPSMTSLYVAFSRCVFRSLEKLPTHGVGHQDGFREHLQSYSTVQELGADFGLPLHHKAELLEALFSDDFAEIVEAFRDAFPSVDELKVVRFHPTGYEPPENRDFYQMALAMKESGIEHLVPFGDMSSGMQRYLSFLIHLSFAPKGTVVLIDELESSLGVNCLPAATRFLLSRAPDLQFIITSHHPYIIEQIPSTHWKIVTRRGSRVRVLDAVKIPALKEERSHLDRFTRLINLPEYEQGIHV